LIEEVELFNVRDTVFATVPVDDAKKQNGMRVQTREGLTVGLALAVRYRLDSSKLAYIQANLPQPIEEEVIAPAIASAFRDLAPGYLVRELFSTKREEVRAAASARIAAKLGADGIVVKEVVLRDIKLPEEYAKGLEGLLLKEQENERLNIVLDVKRKEVQTAQLEAEAQKAREVTAAEARAQMVVLEAKAQTSRNCGVLNFNGMPSPRCPSCNKTFMPSRYRPENRARTYCSHRTQIAYLQIP
jgi:regulator of protease activity HflC (stomatin/prohibitin superfamily)